MADTQPQRSAFCSGCAGSNQGIENFAGEPEIKGKCSVTVHREKEDKKLKD